MLQNKHCPLFMLEGKKQAIFPMRYETVDIIRTSQTADMQVGYYADGWIFFSSTLIPPAFLWLFVK